MTRKQVGMIDSGLLNRVDAAAGVLGQTRRVFIERALEAALSETQGAATAEQADPAPVPSTVRETGPQSEGVRSAAPPRTSATSSGLGNFAPGGRYAQKAKRG